RRGGAAARDAGRRERAGAAGAALHGLAPSVPPRPVGDGEPVRVDRRAAQQKRNRRQRHIVGRVLVETGSVRVAGLLAHPGLLLKSGPGGSGRYRPATRASGASTLPSRTRSATGNRG